MEQDRRAFLEQTGRFIVLTGAASLAWDYVAGRHAAGRAQLRRHRSLVGHDHRHRQVHRLRQLRARLQGRERCPDRRAGLLPHLGRAVSGPAGRSGTSDCRLARRGLRRLPRDRQARRRRQGLLRPEALQPLRALTVRASVPGRARRSRARTASCSSTRTGVWDAGTACRRARTAAGTSIRGRIPSTSARSAITGSPRGSRRPAAKRVRPAARQLVDLKNPKDPVHEFMRTHKVHVLKPNLATGAKAFYSGLDGSVR